jgi:hypothetical protein
MPRSSLFVNVRVFNCQPVLVTGFRESGVLRRKEKVCFSPTEGRFRLQQKLFWLCTLALAALARKTGKVQENREFILFF